MKTQIITLASHDDLVSVRDRMSWAKSPRILLVWPAYEQVSLGALDLRILQQHARQLGAQMGLVTRGGAVRRDAESFGIPVFRSTAEAQRESWSARQVGVLRRNRRPKSQAAELRAMQRQLRARDGGWTTAVAPRILFFTLAVIAVGAIVSLFVPRATVSLSPLSMKQNLTIPLEITSAGGGNVLTGGVAAEVVTLPVSGSQTMRVESRSQVATDKASGTVRFQNLTGSPVVIPRGTTVYSVTSSTVRFATLEESRLEATLTAVADVPIEALEAGSTGNVPANSIQGIEGPLGATTTVTNPNATSGGREAFEPVPSEADRGELRVRLLEELKTKAQAELGTRVGGEGISLPDSLTLATVDAELFDPPAGEPASVLSLAMSVTYNSSYVRSADLQHLAEATLNASMPPGYVPKPDTLVFSVRVTPTPDGSGATAFELVMDRAIMRRIDIGTANRLIRGRQPSEAIQLLEAEMPLAAPPDIRLQPSWWPWLPLIPFRIQVSVF